MPDVSFPLIVDTIRATQGAYHKLTIIVGRSGSGKTGLLSRIAAQLELPVVNLSLLLSQRLLSQTHRQRALRAEQIAIEIVDEHLQSGLCLDNTELLFDSTLRLNPLVFLQDISRNRLIVASWNGALTDGEARFAYGGHPDFFSQAVSSIPVVTLVDNALQLFVAP